MSWLRLLLSLFFIMVFSVVMLSQEALYYYKVEEADKACREERWTDAALLLREAMDLDPENAGNLLLMSNLGMVQHRMGEDSLSIATLTEAHRLAPSSVTILSNRAAVLLECGYDGEAYEDYSLVLDLDSADLTARLRHGMIALRARDIRTARDDFRFLDRNFPSSREARIGMSTLHCALGQYREAIPYYNELIADSPDVEFYTGRALCHLMCDDLQEASDDIAEGLHLNPDDGELYLYRAALNRMRFRPDDAEADARRAVALGIDPARASQFFR